MIILIIIGIGVCFGLFIGIVNALNPGKIEPPKNITFKTTTSNGYAPIKEKDQKWETVPRNSDRWKELGFGDDFLFPGYGKIYNRKIEGWYVDIGSKERKGTCQIEDKRALYANPEGYEDLTGPNVYLDNLERRQNYIELLTGVDSKKRKRWYFGVYEAEPTYIETTRAL